MTCGVAKFSAELAKRLDVPFVGFGDSCGDRPLLSLKWSEIASVPGLKVPRHYSVFWHDSGSPYLTKHATHVFYADPSLGSPGLWCPSLITPRPRPVRLFSFGMAHKLQTDKYQRARELLDAAGKRYHLRVSVGLHEGTSLSDATQHFDALKDIMGEENVTILGILSDDAVSEELSNADYVLAFFEKGLRANNTTVHAALDVGKNVVTNHDKDTPLLLKMSTWNVTAAGHWPRPAAMGAYSWEHLIEDMRKECER